MIQMRQGFAYDIPLGWTIRAVMQHQVELSIIILEGFEYTLHIAYKHKF